MHLIEPLCAGIAGAESGSVHLYARGTTTYVTYYTSFEGDGATTPTAAVALDANGGGVFYVAVMTEVVVLSAGGAEVRRFVAGAGAAGVEVISQSFTGTDYVTAATGASKPTSLDVVLDALYESFGARDFNVLSGATTKTMTAAISGLASLFFSVKDPAYGAVGDGGTDDTAAVTAALDAAGVAGGVVFFPPGIYSVSNALGVTIPAGVSLLGAGAGVSIIRKPANSGTSIFLAAASANPTSIEGLRFDSAVDTTRGGVLDTGGAKITFRDCVFGSTSFTFGTGGNANHANSRMQFYGCIFYPTASASCIGANGGRWTAYDCKFVLPATYNGTVVFDTVAGSLGFGLINCLVDTAAMSAGTAVIIQSAGNNGTNSIVMGCRADNPAGGTISLWVGPGANSDGVDGMLLVGNRFGSAITRSALFGATALASTYRGSMDMERERARYYVADDTAGVSISAQIYALAEVVRTTNGNQTVTLDGPGPVNVSFTLVYHQSAGGASGTITMAGNVKGLTTFTVNATSVSYYFFKAVHRGTSKYWALVGSAVNQTA